MSRRSRPSRVLLSVLVGVLLAGTVAGDRALGGFPTEKWDRLTREDLHRLHRDLGESIALLRVSGFEVTPQDVTGWLRDLGTSGYLAGGSTAMSLFRYDAATGNFFVIAQAEWRLALTESSDTGKACGRLSLTGDPYEPLSFTDIRCPESEKPSFRSDPPCPVWGCSADHALLAQTVLRVQRARWATSPGSPVTLTPRPSPNQPVGDLRADSTELRCVQGTRDLGVHAAYVDGRGAAVRLCAVPGLPSTGTESSRGNAYYVPRSRGEAIVNVRVSGAVRALVRAARREGINLSATSSFRTMRHQRDLCKMDVGCRAGDYTLVAPPGWSQHQLGVAIDFSGTGVTGTRSCGRPATDATSRVWQFLRRHAGQYGFRQYAAESWHWDALPGPARCYQPGQTSRGRGAG